MTLESRSVSLGAKPALIVVDVVNGFTDPDCALGTACPEVVSANKALLDEFRRQRLPIFFTSVVYHNKKQASVFRQKLPAFFTTDLANQLVCCGADSLVVTGLTTSGCVRATAVDGLQHNYPVLIPREACGDRDLAVHEASLYDLDAKYADVISLSDLLVRLCSLGYEESTKQ